MAGDKTLQIQGIEAVIRDTADKVNTMAVSQARTEERQIAMHVDVGELKSSVREQNGRVKKLEGWRWYVVGFIVATGFVLKFAGCASPCAPGYYEPIKTDSVTVERIDSCIDTLG